jgi:hypothetical protein
MNNQVKLIEMIQRKIDELPPFNLMRYEQGKKDAYEEVIAMLVDAHSVPTIGCSKCDYKGYFEYETGVVDEGTQIKEIAKEPCDCVIDPVPTIKPGDKVRHVGSGTHGIAVETSDIGAYVHWSTGQRSWYPFSYLEVVE